VESEIRGEDGKRVLFEGRGGLFNRVLENGFKFVGERGDREGKGLGRRAGKPGKGRGGETFTGEPSGKNCFYSMGAEGQRPGRKKTWPKGQARTGDL